MAKITYIKITNYFPVAVTIKVTGHQDVDWAGECKPHNNLEGRMISPGQTLDRREDYKKVYNPEYTLEFYNGSKCLLCVYINQKKAGNTDFAEVRSNEKDGVNYRACVEGQEGDLLQVTLYARPTDTLYFASVSDLHLDKDTRDISDSRMKKIYNVLKEFRSEVNTPADSMLRPDFVFMQGDITTGTMPEEQDIFEYHASRLDNRGVVVCEGWGNHDIYAWHYSADITGMVDKRNKGIRSSQLPSFIHDYKHYCFRYDLKNRDKSIVLPAHFYMLNLFPGYGTAPGEDTDTTEERNERRMNDPYYSLDILKKYLPTNKKEAILQAFHYPVSSLKSSQQEDYNAVMRGYENAYTFVGHSHSNDYKTPSYGYNLNNNQFLCAGGLSENDLAILFCKLSIKDANTLSLSYRWFRSGETNDKFEEIHTIDLKVK